MVDWLTYGNLLNSFHCSAFSHLCRSLSCSHSMMFAVVQCAIQKRWLLGSHLTNQHVCSFPTCFPSPWCLSPLPLIPALLTNILHAWKKPKWIGKAAFQGCQVHPPFAESICGSFFLESDDWILYSTARLDKVLLNSSGFAGALFLKGNWWYLDLKTPNHYCFATGHEDLCTTQSDGCCWILLNK